MLCVAIFLVSQLLLITLPLAGCRGKKKKTPAPIGIPNKKYSGQSGWNACYSCEDGGWTIAQIEEFGRRLEEEEKLMEEKSKKEEDDDKKDE